MLYQQETLFQPYTPAEEVIKSEEESVERKVRELSYYLTKQSFCRYFKKHTTYTFTEFLNRYRITHAKRELLSGRSSSETCFLSGFDSLSYFNRIFKKVTGETPSGFAKRNRGELLSKFKVEP